MRHNSKTLIWNLTQKFMVHFLQLKFQIAFLILRKSHWLVSCGEEKVRENIGYWTHYQQVITSNALLVMGVTSNGITSNGLNKMGILQIFPLVLKAYFHWLDKQICESDNSSNWTD